MKISRRTLFAAASTAAMAPIAKSASSAEAPAVPDNRGGQRNYRPVRTLNGWTLPYACDERRQGVPPRRRGVRARVRARLPREVLGLQRLDARARRSRRSKAIACASCVTNRLPRAHQHALARHDPAQRHGRRRRPDPAAHPARRNLRLRVHAAPARHAHVPPACRRDGADGAGHDGHVHHPSARRRARARRSRLLRCCCTTGRCIRAPTGPIPSILQDFDLWTFNSKVFPAIEPLVARTGERVRVRVGNLSMWNHPIHMHGVRVPRHRLRRRPLAAQRSGGAKSPRSSASARRATSSSSRCRATGRSTATWRTTR